MNQTIGVYIHIPFCERKCYYCDFVSYEKKQDTIEAYIQALCQEILQNAEILSSNSIQTIYIGGGTPSCIDSKYIVQVLQMLQLFTGDKQESTTEITIEVNPNSVTKEKLLAYKEAGINRISIGLQSTHNHILKTIGRLHTYEDFLQGLEKIKEVGFDKVSVDLMYPLPNLTLEAFQQSIQQVMKLTTKYPISHISVYNLEIHEGTKLEFLIDEGYVTMVSEETEYAMKEWLENELQNSGFLRYEISNYAKPGFESKHNLHYWNQGSYLGFGVAASSFFLRFSLYQYAFLRRIYIQNTTVTALCHRTRTIR